MIANTRGSAKVEYQIIAWVVGLAISLSFLGLGRSMGNDIDGDAHGATVTGPRAPTADGSDAKRHTNTAKVGPDDATALGTQAAGAGEAAARAGDAKASSLAPKLVRILLLPVRTALRTAQAQLRATGGTPNLRQAIWNAIKAPFATAHGGAIAAATFVNDVLEGVRTTWSGTTRSEPTRGGL
ncbi:MAG: hypothetical protein R3A78_03125 [Polyangiales bacterium]|nr:hypothetical protein [Myxococcales bacterium]